MTGRERIAAALKREPSDVVPFDIGGTKVTSLNVRAHRKLRALLGVDTPMLWAKYRSQRTHLSERMSRFFGSDVRRVLVPYHGALPEAVTRPRQRDSWGVEWHQAESGLYYVGMSPLAGAETVDDLEAHSWPDPDELVRIQELAEAARALRRKTDCAICLDLPNGIVHLTQYLRGFEQWLLDSAMDESFFEALLEHVTGLYVETIEALLAALGPHIDLVTFCDDIAIQSGPLINPRVYRQYIKPRHARILDTIRRSCSAGIIFHTCGSVAWVLADLVDIGIDAINPVQVSAADMDSHRLKSEFGAHVCFWGAIDTQHVLPFGTPDEVEEEVRRRVEDLAEGGGYVIAPVHMIQQEVPPENILAMARAAHVYGGRSDGSRFDPYLPKPAEGAEPSIAQAQP
jgi:uroporphyrinogen decarboxylase